MHGMSVPVQYPLHRHLATHPMALHLHNMGDYRTLEYIPLLIYASMFHSNSSGVTEEQYHAIQEAIFEYPSISLNVEAYWTEAIAKIHDDQSSNKAKSDVSSTISNLNNFKPIFEQLSAIDQLNLVANELSKSSMSSSLLVGINLPYFLEDYDEISNSVSSICLRMCIAIICLTAANQDQLMIFLKPIVLCKDAALFIQTILKCHDAYKYVLIPSIIAIFFDSLATDSSIYWKFRRLILSLSQYDSDFGKIFRDILLRREAHHELCMDISLECLDDIVDMIDKQVSNANDCYILNHSFFNNLTVTTLLRMMEYTINKFDESVELSDVSLTSLLSNMKAVTVLSCILTEKLRYHGFKDYQYTFIFDYLSNSSRYIASTKRLIGGILRDVKVFERSTNMADTSVILLERITLTISSILTQIILFLSMQDTVFPTISTPQIKSTDSISSKSQNAVIPNQEIKREDSATRDASRDNIYSQIQSILDNLWQLYREISDHQAIFDMTMQSKTNNHLAAKSNITDGISTNMIKNMEEKMPYDSLFDKYYANNVIYRLVVGKKDQVGIREYCLSFLQIEKITDVLSISNNIEPWNSLSDQLASHMTNIMDLSDNYVITEFLKIARPQVISGKNEISCDWLHCLSLLLKHEIFRLSSIKSDDFNLYETMMYLIKHSMFPCHSRILPLVDNWTLFLVNRSKQIRPSNIPLVETSSDDTKMETDERDNIDQESSSNSEGPYSYLPILPSDVRQLTSKFLSMEITEFTDIIDDSCCKYICRHCFRVKNIQFDDSFLLNGDDSVIYDTYHSNQYSDDIHPKLSTEKVQGGLVSCDTTLQMIFDDAKQLFKGNDIIDKSQIMSDEDDDTIDKIDYCKCLQQDFNPKGSNTCALPGILATYVTIKYSKLCRDVKKSYPSLFECDLTSIPIKCVIQTMGIPHLFADLKNRKILEEMMKLLQILYPSLLLPDRINQLYLSSSRSFIRIRTQSSINTAIHPMAEESQNYSDIIATIDGLSSQHSSRLLARLTISELNDITITRLLPKLIEENQPKILNTIFAIHQIHPLPSEYELMIMNWLFSDECPYADQANKAKDRTTSRSRLVHIPSYQLLIQEPILLLRLHENLLLKETVLALLLHILKGVLVSSQALVFEIVRARRSYRAQSTKQPSQTSHPNRLDLQCQVDPELYLLIQDVMICKLLLSLWQRYQLVYIESNTTTSANLLNDMKSLEIDHGKVFFMDIQSNEKLRRVKGLILDTFIWLRERNKDLMRAMIHFESFSYFMDWILVLSSSSLIAELGRNILGNLTTGTARSSSYTSSNFRNALQHTIYFLTFFVEDRKKEYGLIEKGQVVIYQEFASKIAEQVTVFLIEISPLQVTVFHSISYNETIDSLVSELLDLLVIIYPRRALYLYDYIFKSTEGYAFKRYKDVMKAKYIAINVHNPDDFVTIVLKDRSVLNDDVIVPVSTMIQNATATNTSTSYIHDDIADRDARYTGRKRSYSFDS